MNTCFIPSALIGALEVLTEKQALSLAETSDKAILIVQVYCAVFTRPSSSSGCTVGAAFANNSAKRDKGLEAGVCFDLNSAIVGYPVYFCGWKYCHNRLACLFKLTGIPQVVFVTCDLPNVFCFPLAASCT